MDFPRCGALPGRSIKDLVSRRGKQSCGESNNDCIRVERYVCRLDHCFTNIVVTCGIKKLKNPKSHSLITISSTDKVFN